MVYALIGAGNMWVSGPHDTAPTPGQGQRVVTVPGSFQYGLTVWSPQRNGFVDASSSARAALRIVSQSVAYPVTSDDVSMTIAAFSAVLDDGRSFDLPAAKLTGLTAGTNYGLFRDLANTKYEVEPDPAAAHLSSPQWVFLGWSSTSEGGVYPASPTPPGGWGGAGRAPRIAEE